MPKPKTWPPSRRRRRWPRMDRRFWWLLWRKRTTAHQRQPIISKCFGSNLVRIRHRHPCTPSNNWIIHRLLNFVFFLFILRWPSSWHSFRWLWVSLIVSVGFSSSNFQIISASSNRILTNFAILCYRKRPLRLYRHHQTATTVRTKKWWSQLQLRNRIWGIILTSIWTCPYSSMLL